MIYHNQSLQMTGRITHLDSLRGIACLLVALEHSLLCFNKSCATLLGISPVLFFFLLSGFVLSRSLIKYEALNARDTAGYFVRRVFRLYPAILVALIFSAFSANYFYKIPSDSIRASPWLQESLCNATSVISGKQYLSSFLLKNVSLDHPLWSIRVELLCSFLLPFIIIISKPGGSILRTTILLITCLLLFKTYNSNIYYSPIGFLGFLLPFYLGYLIAENEKHLVCISSIKSLMITVLALTVYLIGFLYKEQVLLCFGMSILLTVLIPCKWVFLLKILKSSILEFLGKISFSFYLLHTPILMITFCAFSNLKLQKIYSSIDIINSLWIFIISVFLTIPLAALSERFVEVPINAIGHRLSKAITHIPE